MTDIEDLLPSGEETDSYRVRGASELLIASPSTV